MPVVRSRARALSSALVAVLAAVGLTVLAPAPAMAFEAPTGLQDLPAEQGHPPIPTLTWDRVGAPKYDVQVATAPSFTGTVVASVTGTTNDTWVPTVSLPSGTLWWRVKANGNNQPWSEPATFEQPSALSPTPLSPDDRAQLQPPNDSAALSWSPVAAALDYQVEYGSDPDFVDPLRKTVVTSRTTTHLVPFQAEGTYYWHVRARVGAGSYGEWSDAEDPPRSYAVRPLVRPSLIAPKGPTGVIPVVQDAVLRWSPVPGAQYYELQINTDEEFKPETMVETASKLLSTSYQRSPTLANDTYFWHVRAVGPDGSVPATWGPTWSFTRTWSDQPEPEYPLAGQAVGGPLVFQWAGAERASSYTLEISTEPDISNPRRCSTIHTTITLTAASGGCAPLAAGRYYWRVIGYDSGAVISEFVFATRSSFTYDPALVSPIAPPANAVATVPTLSWNALAGAAAYRVTLLGANGTEIEVAETTGTTWTPRTSLGSHAYTWQVQSLDAAGAAGPASTRGFVGAPPRAGTEAVPAATGAEVKSATFPTLTWEPVAGAEYYRIHYRLASETPGAWLTVPDDFPYPAGEDPTADLGGGTYEWYAEAFDGDGRSVGSGVRDPASFVIVDREEVTGYRAGITASNLLGTLRQKPPVRGSTPVDAPFAVPGQVIEPVGDPIEDCDATLPDACHDPRQTPILQWRAVPGATSYMLHITKDRNMTTPVGGYPVRVYSTLFQPNASFPDSQAGSAYFWQVTPCFANTCRGLRPSEHSFAKLSNGPTLISPVTDRGEAPVVVVDDGNAEQPAQGQVTLRWEPFVDSQADEDNQGSMPTTPSRWEAASYSVQVATDELFSNVIASASVDHTSYTPPKGMLPEGPLWWRVQAVDGSGNPSAWSNVRQQDDPSTGTFFKRTPALCVRAAGGALRCPEGAGYPRPPADERSTLVMPAQGEEVSGGTALTWQPLPGAATYDVQVFRGTDVNVPPVASVAKTPRTTFTPATALAVGDYTWRVRRYDTGGLVGAWSEPGSFRVTGGEVFPLTTPGLHDRFDPNGVFAWEPVPGATSYLLEFQKDDEALRSVTTPATSWAVYDGLGRGDYGWRVTAKDTAGNALAVSPATGMQDFFVRDTPEALSGVSIAGSGQVGTLLNLTAPSWDTDDTVTTYQWYRGTLGLPQTGMSYLVTQADVGFKMTVRATGTAGGFLPGTSTSNEVLASLGLAPRETTAVRILGTPAVGTTLTLERPGWDTDGVTNLYQWFRGDTAVSGRTGETYLVAAEDVGQPIKVKVTGKKPGYNDGTSESNTVTGVLGPAPQASPAVTIAGSGQVTTTLTSTPATWNVPGVTVTYQWYRGSTAVSGRTTATYLVGPDDAGQPLRLVATAKKTGYADGTSSSNVVTGFVAAPPAPLVAPSITGTGAAKSVLTANPGTWPVAGTAAYQWLVDGVPVDKATAKTFTVAAAHAGRSVSVQVTFTAPGAQPGSATSAAVTIAKLASTTTATTAAKLTTKQKPVVTVKVALADYTVALGKVQVLDKGKVVGTGELKSGTLTLTLNKLKKGKHQLVVEYLGSAATLASASAPIKVKVVKAKKKPKA